MSTATHADDFKLHFYEAVRDMFLVDPATEQVLVTYGAPATYNPPDIVSFLDLTAEQTPATLGNRGREESLVLTISISCVVNGGQEAELMAAQRAYSLLRSIEYYARRIDTTIGGSVRQCFLERHTSSGQTDPALIAQGRVCEIVADFRAQARVSN
jgi:hypothetical protein